MQRSTLKNLTKLGAVAGLTLGLGLGLGTASFARTASDETAKAEAADAASRAAVSGEEVDSFSMLTRLHSWTALDDQNVIVWTTPFQPYLVQLAYPSFDLKFANVIGVTSMGSRVYAKFDAVKVRGFRYPIDSIRKLTREEAKSLTAAS